MQSPGGWRAMACPRAITAIQDHTGHRHGRHHRPDGGDAVDGGESDMAGAPGLEG